MIHEPSLEVFSLDLNIFHCPDLKKSVNQPFLVGTKSACIHMPLKINRKKSTEQRLGFKLKQMHHNCHFHIIYFPFKAFLIQILITEHTRNGSKFYMAFHT